MSDIKELFDMVTKHTEPDLGSWKEQEDRQRRSARNRRNGGFAVAATVILIAAIVLAALRQGDAPPGPLGEPSDTANPSGASGAIVQVGKLVNTNTGLTGRPPREVEGDLSGAELPEVSPDMQAVAYGTLCCSDAGGDAVFVAKLDGSPRTAISPDHLDAYAPTWIDDDTILFQGRPEGTVALGDLYTADLTTGEVTMVTDLPDERNGTAWIVISDVSPDGSTVLYHLPRGIGGALEWDLWTAPIAGGEPTLLRKEAGFAQYAADGSIVYLEDPFPFGAHEIWVMDGDGSRARPIVRGNSTYSFPRTSPEGEVAFGRDGMAANWSGEPLGEEVVYEDVFTDAPAWYGTDNYLYIEE